MEGPFLLDLPIEILSLISQIASSTAYVCLKLTCKTLFYNTEIIPRNNINDIDATKSLLFDSLSNESSDIFIFLRDELKYNINDSIVCDIIAWHGNLSLLKWARNNGYVWTKKTCKCAAKGGHLEVLKYLHENGCPWGYSTCMSAAEGGHLECLKYAHENNCLWDRFTCSFAAYNGHLECLKYAHENGCP